MPEATLAPTWRSFVRHQWPSVEELLPAHSLPGTPMDDATKELVLMHVFAADMRSRPTEAIQRWVSAGRPCMGLARVTTSASLTTGRFSLEPGQDPSQKSTRKSLTKGAWDQLRVLCPIPEPPQRQGQQEGTRVGELLPWAMAESYFVYGILQDDYQIEERIQAKGKKAPRTRRRNKKKRQGDKEDGGGGQTDATAGKEEGGFTRRLPILGSVYHQPCDNVPCAIYAAPPSVKQAYDEVQVKLVDILTAETTTTGVYNDNRGLRQEETRQRLLWEYAQGGPLCDFIHWCCMRIYSLTSLCVIAAHGHTKAKHKIDSLRYGDLIGVLFDALRFVIYRQQERIYRDVSSGGGGKAEEEDGGGIGIQTWDSLGEILDTWMTRRQLLGEGQQRHASVDYIYAQQDEEFVTTRKFYVQQRLEPLQVLFVAAAPTILGHCQRHYEALHHQEQNDGVKFRLDGDLADMPPPPSRQPHDDSRAAGAQRMWWIAFIFHIVRAHARSLLAPFQDGQQEEMSPVTFDPMRALVECPWDTAKWTWPPHQPAWCPVPVDLSCQAWTRAGGHPGNIGWRSIVTLIEWCAVIQQEFIRNNTDIAHAAHHYRVSFTPLISAMYDKLAPTMGGDGFPLVWSTDPLVLHDGVLGIMVTRCGDSVMDSASHENVGTTTNSHHQGATQRRADQCVDTIISRHWPHPMGILSWAGLPAFHFLLTDMSAPDMRARSKRVTGWMKRGGNSAASAASSSSSSSSSRTRRGILEFTPPPDAWKDVLLLVFYKIMPYKTLYRRMLTKVVKLIDSGLAGGVLENLLHDIFWVSMAGLYPNCGDAEDGTGSTMWRVLYAWRLCNHPLYQPTGGPNDNIPSSSKPATATKTPLMAALSDYGTRFRGKPSDFFIMGILCEYYCHLVGTEPWFMTEIAHQFEWSRFISEHQQLGNEFRRCMDWRQGLNDMWRADNEWRQHGRATQKVVARLESMIQATTSFKNRNKKQVFERPRTTMFQVIATQCRGIIGDAAQLYLQVRIDLLPALRRAPPNEPCPAYLCEQINELLVKKWGEKITKELMGPASSTAMEVGRRLLEWVTQLAAPMPFATTEAIDSLVSRLMPHDRLMAWNCLRLESLGGIHPNSARLVTSICAQTAPPEPPGGWPGRELKPGQSPSDWIRSLEGYQTSFQGVINSGMVAGGHAGGGHPKPGALFFKACLINTMFSWMRTTCPQDAKAIYFYAMAAQRQSNILLTPISGHMLRRLSDSKTAKLLACYGQVTDPTEIRLLRTSFEPNLPDASWCTWITKCCDRVCNDKKKTRHTDQGAVVCSRGLKGQKPAHISGAENTKAIVMGAGNSPRRHALAQLCMHLPPGHPWALDGLVASRELWPGARLAQADPIYKWAWRLGKLPEVALAKINQGNTEGVLLAGFVDILVSMCQVAHRTVVRMKKFIHDESRGYTNVGSHRLLGLMVALLAQQEAIAWGDPTYAMEWAQDPRIWADSPENMAYVMSMMVLEHTIRMERGSLSPDSRLWSVECRALVRDFAFDKDNLMGSMDEIHNVIKRHEHAKTTTIRNVVNRIQGLFGNTKCAGEPLQMIHTQGWAMTHYSGSARLPMHWAHCPWCDQWICTSEQRGWTWRQGLPACTKCAVADPYSPIHWRYSCEVCSTRHMWQPKTNYCHNCGQHCHRDRKTGDCKTKKDIRCKGCGYGFTANVWLVSAITWSMDSLMEEIVETTDTNSGGHNMGTLLCGIDAQGQITGRPWEEGVDMPCLDNVIHIERYCSRHAAKFLRSACTSAGRHKGAMKRLRKEMVFRKLCPKHNAPLIAQWGKWM